MRPLMQIRDCYLCPLLLVTPINAHRTIVPRSVPHCLILKMPREYDVTLTITQSDCSSVDEGHMAMFKA